MTFAEVLQNNYIFLDGGMGTMLQARGMQAGERPELLNLKDPALVEQVQRAYVEAGSNIICSNTFGANRAKLTGSGATVQQVIPEGPDVFHVNAHRKRRKGAGHQTVAMADIEIAAICHRFAVISYKNCPDIRRDVPLFPGFVPIQAQHFPGQGTACLMLVAAGPDKAPLHIRKT